MKAAFIERYGPPEVVRIREVAKPEPKDGEVLVRVRATTVNSGDVRLRALRVPPGMDVMVRLAMGIFRPRQPVGGFEMAGAVEAVGKRVTRFKAGDRIVGSAGFKLGCHAEYVCIKEDGALAHIPGTLTDEQAVALPFGGITTLTFFACGHVTGGQSILINGAAGAVGTVAVQIARHLGLDVTAVCSAANADFVRGLGADRVIDYATTDFTATGERWDVIMDNHGNAPFARVKHALKPGGRFLMVIPANLGALIHGKLNKAIVDGEEGIGPKPFSPENFQRLMDLADAGVLKPVIDSTYPFARIADAHARVDTGHKRGSVVVTLE
jgi:NADPH:quinone reductase-like Zn-dependent oxidoreductase